MNKGLNKAALAVIVAVGAISAPPAMAATDGTFGQTSQGTVAISATVPGRVMLTKLSNVVFNDADPAVDAVNAQSVCVWSNTAGRKYTIKATGSGPADEFTLAAGGNTVPYFVHWAPTPNSTSGTPMKPGIDLADQTSSAPRQDCGGATSATLIVGIGSTDLQTMTASTSYTGALTLLVSAQ